jgi:hypothetical protein
MPTETLLVFQRQMRIVPSDPTLRRPSLDDVFLALTGRGTTPGEPEEVTDEHR